MAAVILVISKYEFKLGELYESEREAALQVTAAFAVGDPEMSEPINTQTARAIFFMAKLWHLKF